MGPIIETLSIERFRALRQFSVTGLGRVTLITGKNNVGKSSVLEALRILASDASPDVIDRILRFREEDAGESDDSTRSMDPDGVFLLSTLFHGFPPFTEALQPIILTAHGSARPMRLSIGGGWFSEERDANTGVRRLVPQQKELFGESDSVPALTIDSNGTQRIRSLEYYIRRTGSRARPFRPESSDESTLPCLFVSPYGGERTSPLGALWDRIALSDLENDVVDALKIIDPAISAVSMVGGENSRQQRTAVVRASNMPRRIPLRSFGDGLNRLFGIVLHLVNAKDGLLLIDEFENGMHHTVQFAAWRAVFSLSQRLGVQVFATSHSWDAIEAFQRAATESPEVGVLVRLSRKADDVIATVFSESELTVATREKIEVR